MERNATFRFLKNTKILIHFLYFIPARERKLYKKTRKKNISDTWNHSLIRTHYYIKVFHFFFLPFPKFTLPTLIFFFLLLFSFPLCLKKKKKKVCSFSFFLHPSDCYFTSQFFFSSTNKRAKNLPNQKRIFQSNFKNEFKIPTYKIRKFTI